MILKVIKYFLFSLPLKTEFKNSYSAFDKREGIIIKAIDEESNVTYGEASPLLGFSSESLKELEEEIKLISQNEIFLDDDIENARVQIKNLSNLNSLRFAFEQILLNLLFIRKYEQKKFFSNRCLKKEIYINTVLDISEPEFVIGEIQKKYNQGYRTFKIKIGRENFADDFSLLELVYKKFLNKIIVRLDANGKWSYEKAKSYLKELEKFKIEFIEEPCAELMCNLELAKESKVEIALDECVKNINDAKNIIDESQINFIVVKPMIYGSVFDSIELINYAETKNKCIIVSSAFESSIGKSALVFITSCASHSYAHGLDTSDFFEYNICFDQYAIKNGNINFEIKDFPPSYDLQI
ncbi:MAG: o-succinylbenzoate synthase [Melioribacter sp.]|uniref:o-succinylbenzoate synthase n=1 Tax=Rosettibacter primus TaxID=3111523 RepID=UPI00247F1135|nr:o-succinylbenzoate synthase [Melioribacter sp.]